MMTINYIDTYVVNQLRDSMGLEKAHLKGTTQKREEWRCHVKYVQASSLT